MGGIRAVMCQWNTSEVVALPPNVDTSKEVRSVSLDRCLVPAIKAIWAAGFETLGCCCGHDKEPPNVVVPEGHTREDIEVIAEVLRRVDPERDWQIMQWRLTLVLTSRGSPRKCLCPQCRLGREVKTDDLGRPYRPRLLLC